MKPLLIPSPPQFCIRAPIHKAKMVLNITLEASIEDGITRSPLKSKRVKVTGKASKPTKEYSVEQMQFLVQNLEKIIQASDRMYLTDIGIASAAIGGSPKLKVRVHGPRS